MGHDSQSVCVCVNHSISPFIEKQIEAKKLSERDLPSVMRELKKHAAKWKEIGLHLGFLPGELDNIEAKPSLSQGAPVSWFGAMLQEWLQWAPMDRRGSTSFATLNDLKVALGETGLGASAHDLTLQKNRVGESHKLIIVLLQCRPSKHY